jgi:sterol desaturase/sphingolipid hydroxylase (fatty acid hydroxylase superfamily)
MNFPFLVRTLSYLGMFGAMLLLEWVCPFAVSKQKRRFRIVFHLGIALSNSIVLYLVMTWPILAALSVTTNHHTGISNLLGLRGGFEILATVIAFDFWDYWMHLANHRVGLFWRFHKAHHSDTELDVTTSARFHVGELAISNCLKCLMILIWGPSLWGLVAFDIFLNLASEFHHSNVNIPLSIQDQIEKLIVTPKMHRCHHSLHPDCSNTNYATILSLWDRLFTTHHRAWKLQELDAVGLDGLTGPDIMKLGPFLVSPFA